MHGLFLLRVGHNRNRNTDESPPSENPPSILSFRSLNLSSKATPYRSALKPNKKPNMYWSGKLRWGFLCARMSRPVRNGTRKEIYTVPDNCQDSPAFFQMRMGVKFNRPNLPEGSPVIHQVGTSQAGVPYFYSLNVHPTAADI